MIKFFSNFIKFLSLFYFCFYLNSCVKCCCCCCNKKGGNRFKRFNKGSGLGDIKLNGEQNSPDLTDKKDKEPVDDFNSDELCTYYQKDEKGVEKTVGDVNIFNDKKFDPELMKKYTEYFKDGDSEYKKSKEGYKDDGIIIVLTVDENYLIPAFITIYSVVLNSSDVNINFFVYLSQTISGEKKKMFDNFCDFIKKESGGKCLVFDRIMCKGAYKNALTHHWRLNETVFFRLDIPFYFNDVDKVIYIDSDILVRKNIKEFYDLDFEGDYICAVTDGSICNDAGYKEFKQDGYMKKIRLYEYFNSGVQLINCKKIREDFQRGDLIKLMCIQEQSGGFKQPSQDVMNIAFRGKIKKISPKYNFVIHSYYGGMISDYDRTKFVGKYCSTKEEWESARTDPAIVHFIRPKPWIIENMEGNISAFEYITLAKTDYYGPSQLYSFKEGDIVMAIYKGYIKLCREYYLQWLEIEKKLITAKIISSGWDETGKYKRHKSYTFEKLPTLH